MKRFKLLLALPIFAALFAACELVQPKPEKPDYLVSINEIIKYPRASRLEKEIPTIVGTTKWISTSPYLFSNCIRKIETLPNESDKSFFDLKLELNARGRLLWNQVWADLLYREMGFVVNDVLYRRLTPEMIVREKDNIIILKLKLDSVTAKSIADFSESNYKYFNPDEGRSPF